jgi:hypothetical protein
VPLGAGTLVALLIVACGGGRGASDASRPPLPEPLAETCSIRLPARESGESGESREDGGGAVLPALPPAAGPGPVVARSTLVVNAELPLAGIRQALEAKVPRRVAEERDHDLGRAGRLEYTVDRGPFTVRVEANTLVVESVLQGNARACARGSCYAGCAPEARVTAKVPLRLSADYKLRTSEVRIDVTRGCEVRALGGLLTIDVTPVLRGALAAQSRTVQASIDRELPDMKPEATKLWAELGKPRMLPLGMCVSLAPEEMTQGPASGTADLARLRFGLLARPEIRVKCGAAAPPGIAPPGNARPLPPLRDDPALPAAGDVHLAIVLPDDAPARALERDGEIVDFGGRRARVKQASGDVASGLVLGLTGDVCGEAAMSVAGAAWKDAQSIHLVGAAPMAGENERLAGVQLDAARLARAVEHAPIAVPIDVSSLDAALPELARAMSDDQVTVGATVESAKPESAGLRGTDVVAIALLRGAVTLRAK